MTTRSDTKKESNRKLVFTVPAELHQRISEAADDEDRSMASWIRRALESVLTAAAK